MPGDVVKPATVIRSVYAEPDGEPASPCRGGAGAPIGEVAWLALWEDGAVTRHASARALLRAVRRRDRRDAERADHRGEGAIFATLITWNHTPLGFVPPTSEDV